MPLSLKGSAVFSAESDDFRPAEACRIIRTLGRKPGGDRDNCCRHVVTIVVTITDSGSFLLGHVDEVIPVEDDSQPPAYARHHAIRGAAPRVSGPGALHAQQSRQALDTLREGAVIRSAESSNRIEGVEAAPDRLKKLITESTASETRSERAIAGYRDILNTIHTRHEDIEFSTGVVCQFHRDLFEYTSSRGGDWKSTGNDIAQEHPDGTEVVRFETVPPHRTPEHMKTLHERFDRA